MTSPSRGFRPSETRASCLKQPIVPGELTSESEQHETSSACRRPGRQGGRRRRIERGCLREAELPLLRDRMEARCDHVEVGRLVEPRAWIGLRCTRALEVDAGDALLRLLAKHILALDPNRLAALEPQQDVD